MTAVATRPQAAAAMKWWGWGDEDVAFTHDGQAGASGRSSARTSASTSRRVERAAPIAFEDLDDPGAAARPALRAALEEAVGEHVSDDALDRVVHARGKSLRDLVRQRRGDLGRLPDVVVRPADEDDGRARSCAPRSRPTPS